MVFKGCQTQLPLLFLCFTGIFFLFFFFSKNANFRKFCIRSSIWGNPEGCWLCSTVLLCEGVVCVRVCPNNVILCTGNLYSCPTLCLPTAVCILAYSYSSPCVGKQPSKLQATAPSPVLASTGAAAVLEGFSQPMQMITAYCAALWAAHPNGKTDVYITMKEWEIWVDKEGIWVIF